MTRFVFLGGRRTFLARIVLLIAGLALAALCAMDLALEYGGESAAATIADVRFDQRHEWFSEHYTTDAHVAYTYVVEGKQYTGSATFSISSRAQSDQTGAIDPSGYDRRFRQDWENRTALLIKYLHEIPQISNAAQLTETGFWGTTLHVAGMLLALALILLSFKHNKQSTPTASAPPRSVSPAVPPSQSAPAECCPHCGAPANGGAFCEYCGSKLS